MGPPACGSAFATSVGATRLPELPRIAREFAMSATVLGQLQALVVQLESRPQHLSAEELCPVCTELLRLGAAWPDTALGDPGLMERFSHQLLKFPDAHQQHIAAALPPLQENVRQRMVASTDALNSWLSEVSELAHVIRHTI